jgi:hypothetical protein
MDTVKQCQAQAAECLALMQAAHSDTEARLLKSLSQSWVRVANQIERYQSQAKARASRSRDQLHPQLHYPV